MKEIFIGNIGDPWGGLRDQFSYAVSPKKGQIIRETQWRDCRDLLSLEITKSKYSKKLFSNSRWFKGPGIELVPAINPEKIEEPTYLLFYIREETERDCFIARLPSLHRKEKQANVALTEVFKTQNSQIFLIQGSGWWKQSVWKMYLYSFYLRCLVAKGGIPAGRPEYKRYKELLAYEGNEELLLSKVATEKRERYATKNYTEGFQSYRSYKMGFVSIIRGENEPMRKLLGLSKP